MKNQPMDPQAQAYFDSLPQVLKSQIVQSGVCLPTQEDLEAYTKNVLGSLSSGQEQRQGQ